MAKMTRRQVVVGLVALPGLAAYGGASVRAAEPYPNRTIRIVVPFTPGGGNDFMARLIAQKLGERLGQQVIVENVAGAGGAIGTGKVAKATPDGYTLLLGSVSTVSINPCLYSNLPFDVVRDLAPISVFAATPALLVVRADFPVSSVKDLVALAKANPGKLNFASAGIGTSHQLASELFKYVSDINIIHVPYKGSAPAVTGLLGGEVQMMFADIPAVLPMVQAGKFKALAVASLKRSTILPDVPTVVEAGYPDFEVLVWYGVLAPAGTPVDILDKLNAEIHAVAEMPEVKKLLAAQGAEPAPSSRAEFSDRIKREIRKWSDVVTRADIHIN
jgi:tripartite-type tricarboxylate transporter receptor subunit TctC